MFSHLDRLAVVGAAKNSGKTTTLNAIAEYERTRGRTVGILSIGIDGEQEDVLIGTSKPPVHVFEGEVLVTTSHYADEATASFEYISELGIRTPLGEALVVRCVQPGEVVLAGLRHRGDYDRAARELQDAGADLVLIDGAYGRMIGARIAQGVILSTGGVLGRNVESVVRETARLVDLFRFETVELEWQRELIQLAISEERTFLGGPDSGPRALESRSALVALSEARNAWTDADEAIAIPGLVSNGVVEELLAVEGARTLLIPDPTVVHAAPRLMRRLLLGWHLRVLDAPELIGISVNPTSPRGPTLDIEELIAAIGERWPDVWVFDSLTVPP